MADERPTLWSFANKLLDKHRPALSDIAGDVVGEGIKSVLRGDVSIGVGPAPGNAPPKEPAPAAESKPRRKDTAPPATSELPEPPRPAKVTPLEG